ncbi:hypothetical protein PN36_29465 [Candidatus Thiomargarita nelsonii]|uniref:Uncharacterized protein n=1 Tax=Candidatus Thiomargarita nelsonii TaxID=1003181 RepID=A0A0A6S9Z0_9GAMM|nr:hypothetical protein PN36_29465 [Candidatus Thiomargarita nelsonii]
MNEKNPKGAGAKPTVWKHGGVGKITTINVPKISKQLIHKIAIVIDHEVINNSSYSKKAVLTKIERFTSIINILFIKSTKILKNY